MNPRRAERRSSSRHSKRNRETTGDTKPYNRVVKQKLLEEPARAGDLDLLSNVAGLGKQAHAGGRKNAGGGLNDQNIILEDLRSEDVDEVKKATGMVATNEALTDKPYTTFPDRLMELLESDDEAIKKAIWWLPSGDSFAISPDQFNGKLLSRFFRGIRLTQVLQKLSRWGFRPNRDVQVGDGAQVYSHNLFRRGQPVLFKKYEAARLKPRRSAAIASTEPVTVGVSNSDPIEKQAVKKPPAAVSDEKAPKEKESASKMIKEAELSLSFPERLMDLLDSAEDNVKKAIWWLPEGDTFAISPNHFSDQILSKYFQGSQFGSFIRKLNRWGFKKTQDDKLPFICYYHEFFKRGMPHLCRQIHSGKKGNLKQMPQQMPASSVGSIPREPQAQSAKPPQPLQQLLASAAAAPQVASNLNAASLLGSSLASPESILLNQVAALQHQQQQQQQLAAVNALAQQRLADLVALSQLDAARVQLQQLGGAGGLQSLLSPSISNPTSNLQTLLSLQSDPLALALAQQDPLLLLQQQQQQQQQGGVFGSAAALQRQILIAQAMQAERDQLNNTNNNSFANQH